MRETLGIGTHSCSLSRLPLFLSVFGGGYPGIMKAVS